MTRSAALSAVTAVADALQRLAALSRQMRWEGEARPLLIGGAVRDALLGRPVAEADLTIPGDAAAFARLAAECLQTRAVRLDERIGVDRLPLAAGHIDIVQMVGDLRSDLARRDFTINALAYPLAELPPGGPAAIGRERIIDQHAGLADLDEGVIRIPAPGVLRDDPLRALRGVRLAAELGYRLEPATEAGIRDMAPQVRAVAAERVGAELRRIFTAERASTGIALMEATGLLRACFPELDAGRGVEQRPQHCYDVFEHQLAALRWADTLLASQPPPDWEGATAWSALWCRRDWSRSRWGDVREQLRRHQEALRIAVLLHDVGKPATRSVTEDGRTRFFGHAPLGALTARDALKRWRFPGSVVERVALLIEQHLRPGQMSAPGQPPTARSLHRFHKALGDAVPDLCWLFLADSLATVGPERLLPRWPAYVEHVHGIVTWQPSQAAATVAQLVDGHAVMAATGLGPGPLVGRILAAVEEGAAAGELGSEEDALSLARSMARDNESAAGDPPRTQRPPPGA